VIYRLCAERLPDGTVCAALTNGTRCTSHVRAADRKRGTARERGIGGRDWERVRLLVLRRDNYQCQIRGRRCTEVATVVDHIVPRSKGGSRLDIRNLRAACRWCNTSKGARDA
jgi:5-methylcytosine-specific restriction endonuclease McrA